MLLTTTFMDADKLSELIEEFGQRCPGLDRDLCLLYLEDVGYNVDRAVQCAKETENDGMSFNYQDFLRDEWHFVDDKCDSCVNKEVVASLMQRFPSASEEIVKSLLEALCGNVENVIGMLREDYQEVVPFHEIKERLCLEFPRIPPAQIASIVDIAEGNIDFARSLLRDDAQTKKSTAPRSAKMKKNVMYEMGNKIGTGAAQPRQKKNKPRTDPFIFDQLRKNPPKTETPVEALLHLGFARDKIEKALELVQGDVERAANLLLTNNFEDDESDLDRLAAIFETTPRSEIEEILRDVQDYTRAANILATALVDNPRPEDSIIALAPDISVQGARKIIEEANGNIEEATDIIFRRMPVKKPAMKRASRLRNLTIDLHNFTGGKAANYVRKALENAKESGDIGVINFITGQGLHSPGHVPVLRPRVWRICKDMGMDVRIGANKGVVVCTIRR